MDILPMISFYDPKICYVLKELSLIFALSIDANVSPKSAITLFDVVFIVWPGDDLFKKIIIFYTLEWNKYR